MDLTTFRSKQTRLIYINQSLFCCDAATPDRKTRQQGAGLSANYAKTKPLACGCDDTFFFSATLRDDISKCHPTFSLPHSVHGPSLSSEWSVVNRIPAVLVRSGPTHGQDHCPAICCPFFYFRMFLRAWATRYAARRFGQFVDFEAGRDETAKNNFRSQNIFRIRICIC